MMGLSRHFRQIIAGACALALASAFTAPSPAEHRCHWRLFASEGDGATGSSARNEFSRTISVSKWFNSGGSPSNRRGNKQMELSISAKPAERTALATRFRLSNITALSAEIVVRPAMGVGSDTSGSRGVDGNECIDASGTVCAEVTQTCVRTNEEFDVSLEFSFDTVLKAMASTSASNSGSEPLSAGEAAALEAASRLEDRRPRKKKGGGKPKGVRGGQSIDDMGMKEMQDILMEYEVTDEIIEDENCFCTDGTVDCGEIVAQMFRSKLDPYPKKPGTDPVSYSFTF